MNKTAKIALITAAAGLPIFLLAPGHADKEQRRPFMRRYFAHRGLHSEDKQVPENSMAAFRLASEAGYGIELDVQLSKDGHVVVFHDNTLDRVCGVHGRIDEFDYDELRTFTLCGTKERIPLFSHVLQLIDGRGPLIVELKDGRRNKELCRKTYELLKNYKGDVCIESFNPVIVAWFRRHAKGLLRGQLAQTQKHYEGEVKKPLDFLLANCLLNCLARPQFIAYRIEPRPFTVRLSELMGAMRFGWTSHNAGDKKGRDGVIFEFYTPELKY